MIAEARILFFSLDPIDLVIDAGMFVSVLLLVYGIFSQPGRIRLSAQREAALATGHTDRSSPFENPILRPVLWLLLLLSHRLNIPRLKSWVRRNLVAAGSPKYYTAEEFLALAGFAGLCLGLILEGLYVLAFGGIGFVGLAVGVLLGMTFMLLQLHEQASSRLREISKRVPYALDLVALAMGAGATFTEAIRTVTRERGDDALNVEFRTLLAEMELGSTRRTALENLADRVPLDSLRMVVAGVGRAEELGTPLGDVLRDEASLLRLQRSRRAEDLAAKASVRILLPCLLLVAAVLLAVMAPMFLRGIRGGLF